MIARSFRSLVRDEAGAVSPLYAIAILALVGMAGVGFDYGRMVALDTELQNAADQAALAAATQLDGGDDAIDRAQAAARDAFATASSQFVNETRFSTQDDDDDDNPRPITRLSFKFFEDYSTDPDEMGDEVPVDGNQAAAKVVEVTVDGRGINYALTPLIGAISDIAMGRATATLEGSTCNVPPIMFCLPSQGGVVDHGFPAASDYGKSLQLHIKKTNNSWPWAPGNFGFLDIDYDIEGKDKTRSLGLNSDYLGCTGEGVQTEPGNKDPQADALNSRFDEYSGSVKANACNGVGDFCPSESVRKDLVMVETTTVRGKIADLQQPPARPNCGSYTTRSGPIADTAVNSFKADNCILNGGCSVLGDGVWDYNNYFNTRRSGNAKYPPVTASDFGKDSMDDVTRYDVYLWELQDPDNRLQPERLSSSPSPTFVDQGQNRTWTVTNHCAYPEPMNASAVEADATQKDRRVLTVAAVDCTGLNGKGVANIVRWVDVFMLQPVFTTGSDKEFRAEIIGPAQLADGGSGFQYFGRKKAVLIR